jgi:hypothetical protein
MAVKAILPETGVPDPGEAGEQGKGASIQTGLIQKKTVDIAG